MLRNGPSLPEDLLERPYTCLPISPDLQGLPGPCICRDSMDTTVVRRAGPEATTRFPETGLRWMRPSLGASSGGQGTGKEVLGTTIPKDVWAWELYCLKGDHFAV